MSTFLGHAYMYALCLYVRTMLPYLLVGQCIVLSIYVERSARPCHSSPTHPLRTFQPICSSSLLAQGPYVLGTRPESLKVHEVGPSGKQQQGLIICERSMRKVHQVTKPSPTTILLTRTRHESQYW